MSLLKLPTPRRLHNPHDSPALSEDELSASASASADEDRESGEISEPEHDQPSFKGYKPEYEWPGTEADFPPSGPSDPLPTPVFDRPLATTDLRLVVLSTSGYSFLRGKTVAVINTSEGCSIGRDSAPGPRLRLREMPVSKFHASIFWDSGLASWAVVDMGSMHGTFVHTTGSEPVRLSPPRVASQPRALKHLDNLIIGSTTFLVHAHKDGLPCEVCFAPQEKEIPLYEENKNGKSESSSTTAYGPTLSSTQKRVKHKHDMSSLKSSLLSTLPTPATTPGSGYIDRSAKRRKLHPEPRQSSGTSSPAPFPRTPPEPISAPSQPIQSSNIGHALLLKQGWTPGMTLGTESSNALSEPIVAVGTSGRAGLGAKRRQEDVNMGNAADWREQGKQKRFRMFQNGI